jgi:hypothetical protein
VLSIENLETFSKTLTIIGEKYHLDELTEYGKSLGTLTQGHQIDQIIRMLPRFREYINNMIKPA